MIRIIISRVLQYVLLKGIKTTELKSERKGWLPISEVLNEDKGRFSIDIPLSVSGQFRDSYQWAVKTFVKLDKRKSRMTHTVPNFVFSFPFRPNTWPAVHQRPYKKFQVSGVVELSRHVPELDICIFPPLSYQSSCVCLSQGI